MRIANQCVVVTGASAGIGSATVRLLQRLGARVALVARNEEALRNLARPNDAVIAGDLLDGSFRATVVERAAAEMGRVDILINNAGIGLYQPAETASLDLTRRMFDLNFFAPLELAQQAVAIMRTQGTPAAVVNVSSIAGRMALPWFTLYSASKFALCAFSSGLRMELAGSGIHVMGVLPGYVKTGFQDHVLGGSPPPAVRDAKRFAVTADECAAAIVRGIESGARTVVTPGAGRFLTGFATLLPFVMESRLVAMHRRLERGA